MVQSQRLGTVAALALALSLSACGGDSSEPHYQSEAIRDCLSHRPEVVGLLVGNGFDTTGPEDEEERFGFPNAAVEASAEGWLLLNFESNEADLGFERNKVDAEDALEGAATFGSEGLAERRGNVHVWWSQTPTDAEQGAVEGCLPKDDQD